MRYVLAAFLLLAPPCFADEEYLEAPVRCRGELCIAPREFMAAMMQAHNELVQENRDLKALKTPKCADLTVTEPSKEKEARPVIPRDPATERKS